MGKGFWAKRLVSAFVIAGAALFAVQLAKGHAWPDAMTFGATWGAVFAAIFTGIGYARYRRNPACMLRNREPR